MTATTEVNMTLGQASDPSKPNQFVLENFSHELMFLFGNNVFETRYPFALVGKDGDPTGFKCKTQIAYGCLHDNLIAVRSGSGTFDTDYACGTADATSTLASSITDQTLCPKSPTPFMYECYCQDPVATSSNCSDNSTASIEFLNPPSMFRVTSPSTCTTANCTSVTIDTSVVGRYIVNGTVTSQGARKDLSVVINVLCDITFTTKQVAPITLEAGGNLSLPSREQLLIPSSTCDNVEYLLMKQDSATGNFTPADATLVRFDSANPSQIIMDTSKEGQYTFFLVANSSSSAYPGILPIDVQISPCQMSFNVTNPQIQLTVNQSAVGVEYLPLTRDQYIPASDPTKVCGQIDYTLNQMTASGSVEPATPDNVYFDRNDPSKIVLNTTVPRMAIFQLSAKSGINGGSVFFQVQIASDCEMSSATTPIMLHSDLLNSNSTTMGFQNQFKAAFLNLTVLDLIPTRGNCGTVTYEMMTQDTAGSMVKADPSIIGFADTSAPKYVYVNTEVARNVQVQLMANSSFGTVAMAYIMVSIVQAPSTCSIYFDVPNPQQSIVISPTSGSTTYPLKETISMMIKPNATCDQINYDLYQQDQTSASGVKLADPQVIKIDGD